MWRNSMEWLHSANLKVEFGAERADAANHPLRDLGGDRDMERGSSAFVAAPIVPIL